MKALRIFACYLTTIKLLVAAPFLLLAVIIILAGLMCSERPRDVVIFQVHALLGAIGLGYPFLLIRTRRFVTCAIVLCSTIPFCSIMILLLMDGFESWASGILPALTLPALTLADFFLSKRVQAKPERLSGVTRFFTIGCALLSLGIAAPALHFSFGGRPGRPYQAVGVAFQGDSRDLHQSVVVPTLDTPMPKGKNIVWCGTIQLAWNHLGKDVLCQPPQVQDAEAVVSRLNLANFGEDDLPPDSYLATAGFAKDGVAEKVQSEMKRMFQRKVEIDPMSPNDILAYAYLEAKAAFTIPFFDNRKVFRFRDSSAKTTEVTSFGIEKEHEYAYHALRKQIDVLYSLRKDNAHEELEEFVIDLCKDSSPNQIVVACVPPKETLLDTLKDVEKKSQEYAKQDRSFGVRDVLLVPNLNWEVQHHFTELEGSDKRFLNAGFNDYHIAKAMQTIRFQLDRSGAEVASEFQQVCKPMATHFLLDRPFLIIVKKRGAEMPFFVMWVDNAELLSTP